MAVMASQILDKPSFEQKTLAPTADIMTLDSDMNGVATSNHDSTVQSQVVDTLTATLNGNGHAQNGAVTLPDPMPIKDVSSGIAPIASFLPEQPTDPAPSLQAATEAPTSDVRDEPVPMEETSHVLPPTATTTEQPSDAMDTTADDNTAPPSHDAPAESDTTALAQDLAMTDAPQSSEAVAPVETSAPLEQPSSDAPSQSKTRAREEDESEDQPLNKRVRTSEDPVPPSANEDTAMTTDETAKPAPEPVPAPTEPISMAQSAAPPEPVAAPAPPLAYTPEMEHFDSEPMIDRQKQGLAKVLQNAKKAKCSIAFREPVDPVALNIPSYPEIVKEPMDLKTMETKLKSDQYSSVDDFLADLARIVRNTYMFNGANHAVTHQARELERYVNKAITNNAFRNSTPAVKEKSIPPPPEKKEIRRRSAVKIEKPAAPAAPPPAPSPTTYATLDGVPIIRRGSSHQDGRPKREIQRPKPRDLPYSVKPRKKKFQMDLRFCEHVISEIKKPKVQKAAWPFMQPVDPVALNIPEYHNIIKKPMDVSKVEENLKGGEYQNAKEFKGDMDLIFANCFKFNPDGDSINALGKEFKVWFDAVWEERSLWISKNQPVSDPGSDEDSEDDYVSDDNGVEALQARLVEVNQQMAALGAESADLLRKIAEKQTKVKKSSKHGKSGKSRKSGGGSKKEKKPKKAPAPLTFGQKQEISESIGQLGEDDMAQAMNIIQNGVPHLKNQANDDELEIDMESIPEDVLRQLLKFVRGVRPSAAQPDVSDDDFEPPKSAGPKSSGKPKKNKPMGKKEQEENIEAIKRQLSSFQKASSGSEEPPSANGDSSSDEDDADSESEEE